jgi:hypothetical protein
MPITVLGLEVHAAQQVGEARVEVERIETWERLQAGASTHPKAGWKGKERLDDLGYPHAHSETEKGASPKVVHFQIRPNPLAH